MSTNANCFQDIPRTVQLALNSGWRRVKGSTCENNGKFYGYRLVKNDDYAITPLYDELGTIAGIQVNVSVVVQLFIQFNDLGMVFFSRKFSC